MKKLFTTIIMIAIMLATLSINQNLTYAADETSQEPTVKTSVYGENKAIKVELTNINLDDTHEYQYGVSLAKATQPTNWYALAEIEKNSATLVITPEKEDMLTILRTTESACVFVKDVTDDKVVIDGVKASLKMNLTEALNLTPESYKFSDGKVHDRLCLQMIYGLTKIDDISKYKYAVEKIDDVNIIKKYLQAKENNSNKVDAVKDLLSNEISSNVLWKSFYTKSKTGDVFVSETETSYSWEVNSSNSENFLNLTKYEGLYRVWGQVSFSEGRSIYGYTLYDTFPDGYKLAEQNNDTNQSTDTGNNNGATNNDDTNKGTTTPETPSPETGSGTTTPGQTDTNSGNGQTVTPKTDPEDDNTTASTGKLPYTGMGIGIIAFIAVVFAIGTVAYCKYFRLKDI